MAIRVGRLGQCEKRLSVMASACQSRQRDWARSCGCAGVDPAAVRPLWHPTQHRYRSSTEAAFPLCSSPTFEKPIPRQGKGMLEPAMFIGLGLVAVWAYVRYPRLRPGSLVRAAVHVALSFLAFAV